LSCVFSYSSDRTHRSALNSRIWIRSSPHRPFSLRFRRPEERSSGTSATAVTRSGLKTTWSSSRDGQQPKSRPAQPTLAAGWINPSEIKNLKVRVFVSHSHEDHFGPVIFTWRTVIRDIAYYFGWKATDDPSYSYLVGPRAELKSGGLEIATINSHHSGVPEVAWLVKVDGLVIYHNGDCQPDDPSSELDFLKTKTEIIDLAFVFPVYEEDRKYTTQNLDFFGKFRVRAAFPMHAQAGDAMYLNFQKAFQAKFSGLPIHVPMRLGHKFVFERGRVTN
jgi:L-ascorbate metabolism protein UlaG (beta-lactamase superfamily)